MKQPTSAALWAVPLVAIGLFAAQTALANSDRLTLRYLLNTGVIAGAALLVMIVTRRSARALLGPAPEPVSLALAGAAALCLWAPAWWLMDALNYALDRHVGLLTLPEPITGLPDRLLGVTLNTASYELGIAFAVVVLPWAAAWLLWGLYQPELDTFIGRRRAAIFAGLTGGAFFALTAVQNVAPALPWGTASVPGYIVIGLVAAWAVYLTGSPWAGFTAFGTFAYASFAWRDDLFRQFAGKDYWDPAWLTVLLLGTFGAVICLQAIRYRVDRLPEPDRLRKQPAVMWLAVIILLTGVIVLIALDRDARHPGTRATSAARADLAPDQGWW